MVTIRRKSNFDKTFKFLRNKLTACNYPRLEQYGQECVDALSSVTPSNTGKTAMSWGYEVIRGKDFTKLVITNSNVTGNIPVVILLQFGHATMSGAYVEGYDFINPAVEPIFKKISEYAKREVSGK